MRGKEVPKSLKASALTGFTQKVQFLMDFCFGSCYLNDLYGQSEIALFLFSQIGWENMISPRIQEEVLHVTESYEKTCQVMAD